MKENFTRPYLSSRTDPWKFLEFIQKRNRQDFVTQFNIVLGAPSDILKDMQDEFIIGRLDPTLIIAFVQVCRGLISTDNISPQ